MEEEITITRNKLIAALAQWEEDTKAGKTEPSTDPKRHAWSADYLINLMK